MIRIILSMFSILELPSHVEILSKGNCMGPYFEDRNVYPTHAIYKEVPRTLPESNTGQ